MRIFLPILAFSVIISSSLRAKDPVALLTESFSGKELPANFHPGGRKNSWSVLDGVLRGVARPDDAHGPSIGVPIDGKNLLIEFDFRFVSKGQGVLIFLVDGDSQFKGQAHLFRYVIFGDTTFIQQDRGDPASKKAQKIAKDKNGGKRIAPTKEDLADPTFYRVEKLASAKKVTRDGKWHHVRIELKGNTATVQTDKSQRIKVIGSVWDEKKSRIVFLVGQSGEVHIDKVKVKAL